MQFELNRQDASKDGKLSKVGFSGRFWNSIESPANQPELATTADWMEIVVNCAKIDQKKYLI